MKKFILLFLLLAVYHTIKAQNFSFKKQETLDRIERVFKSSYSYEGIKILSLILEGEILNISLDNGNLVKKDLSKPESIVINKMSPGFIIHYSSNIFDSILWAIQTEEDAQQLKKELQHLIEILKIENTEISKD
ncbi:MAG: hypothetical protein WBA61_17085 [Aequorivita sp.]